MKAKVFIKDGVKYYPVGNYLTYQHVFHNAVDKALCQLYDAQDAGEDIDKAQDWLDRVNYLFDRWMFNPQKNGIVYAVYEDYSAMKDIIGAYAWTHGGGV